MRVAADHVIRGEGRLLSFSFIYNSDPNNVRDLQGYLVNNYDIILTTLSSSGLAAFDSDYVNRK